MGRIACCLLLVALAARADDAANLFFTIQPAIPGAPPQILWQHELTAADEQPKDARNVISNATVHNPQKLPLGPNSRILGTFRSQAGKGSVKVVLDWAGEETGAPPRGSRDGIVVINVFFACEGTNDYCGDNDPRRPHDFQQLFYVAPIVDSKQSTREVVIDGTPHRLYVAHGTLANDIPADRDIAVHVSFNSPPHIRTHRLRATLLYGEFGVAPPAERRALPGWTRYLAVAILALLVASWWRRGRSEDPYDSDDPPKVLGALLRVLGLLWAIAGIVFLDAYSMALGVLLAAAGGFLYYGRSLAVPAMWAVLIVAWTWSIREAGTDVKTLLPRVGLVTILWAWVVFGGTASRLGTRGEG